MKECDVVVVGGGAAGLSAALVLVRARRTVVVVDAGAPRNAPARICTGSCPGMACHHASSWRQVGLKCPTMAAA